jgi:AraC-like DNA-binding protein
MRARSSPSMWSLCAVRTQRDLGRVHYHERRPHSILEDTVRCFWTHEGTYSSDTVQSITPDGCVELIFNFGSPYLLLTTTPRVLPTAVLVGFQKKTMPIKVDGTVKVVAARLFAWGALALLEDEIRAPCDSVTALGVEWATLVRRLENEVTEGRYEEAAKTLEIFLIQKALSRSYDPKLVRTAAKLLYHTKGQCRIEELADSCHASVRQLQRGFQSVVGASPKLFARILRFEQAQRRLMTDSEIDLTGLAHECGYFDQAHFIKEFRAFTGKTPSEYAREMRRLQDHLKSQDVVFLQS